MVAVAVASAVAGSGSHGTFVPVEPLATRVFAVTTTSKSTSGVPSSVK